jgi:hypothetical protein
MGRCAGCGRSGPAKKISAHQLNCEPFQMLYLANPDKALGPLAEQARWEAEDKVCGRDARKDRMVSGLTATLALRTQALQRFARLPDVLED